MDTYTLRVIKIALGISMTSLVVDKSLLTYSSHVPREKGNLPIHLGIWYSLVLMQNNLSFMTWPLSTDCCEVVKLSIFDDLAFRCQNARTGLYLKQETDINGKAFYIHGGGENAIWYYSDYDQYFWSIGNVDDKGTSYVGLYSTESKTCPNEIYYKSWLFTCGAGFRPARSVLVQCSSIEGGI